MRGRRATTIAARRSVAVAWEPFYELAAAPCDPALQDALAEAIARQGLPVRHLPSGAGHDAMVFADRVPDRDAVRALRRRRHQPPSGGDDDGRGRRDRAPSVLLHFLEHFEPARGRR